MDDMKDEKVDENQSDASQGDIASEFRTLGNNITSVLKEAWESEERKKLQMEIEAGLRDFSSSLEQTFTDFKESSTGEQLRSDVEEFRASIKSGKVESEVRSGLLSALRSINEELEKLSKSKSSEVQDKFTKES